MLMIPIYKNWMEAKVKMISVKARVCVVLIDFCI